MTAPRSVSRRASKWANKRRSTSAIWPGKARESGRMRNELGIILLLAAGAHAEERIGFGDAVHQALQRNPNVTVALEEINRARGLAEEVRSQWLPTLALNGTFTQLDGD